ncbi:hypothetical protein FOLKNPGA_00040 [Legionella sp. PC1000]|nr:hypothetical protein FOLKNPGA_00040 [Legionella sp. PC1000]
MRGIQNNILRCRGAFLEQDPLDTAHKARYVGEKIKRDTQAKKLVAVSHPKTDDTAGFVFFLLSWPNCPAFSVFRCSHTTCMLRIVPQNPDSLTQASEIYADPGLGKRIQINSRNVPDYASRCPG